MMTPVLYLFSLLKSLNSETQLLEACEWDENRLAYVKSEIEKCMSDYLSMQLVVDEDSLVEGFRASLLENITEKEADACIFILREGLSSLEKTQEGKYEN